MGNSLNHLRYCEQSINSRDKQGPYTLCDHWAWPLTGARLTGSLLLIWGTTSVSLPWFFFTIGEVLKNDLLKDPDWRLFLLGADYLEILDCGLIFLLSAACLGWCQSIKSHEFYSTLFKSLFMRAMQAGGVHGRLACKGDQEPLWMPHPRYKVDSSQAGKRT